MELIVGEGWRSGVSLSFMEKACGGHLSWVCGDAAAPSSLGAPWSLGLDLSGLRPFQNPMKAIPLWPAKGMHAQDGSHVATPRSPAGALELGSPAEEGVLG